MRRFLACLLLLAAIVPAAAGSPPKTIFDFKVEDRVTADRLLAENFGLRLAAVPAFEGIRCRTQEEFSDAYRYGADEFLYACARVRAWLDEPYVSVLFVGPNVSSGAIDTFMANALGVGYYNQRIGFNRLACRAGQEGSAVSSRTCSVFVPRDGLPDVQTFFAVWESNISAGGGRVVIAARSNARDRRPFDARLSMLSFDVDPSRVGVR